MSGWLAIIRTINRRSPHTMWLTRSTLALVLLIKSLPLLVSTFIYLQPSLNLLFHSKTRFHKMVLSPFTYWSISSASERIFPNWTKHFRFVYSSVIIADWSEKEKTSTKTCKKCNACKKLNYSYILPRYVRQSVYPSFAYSSQSTLYRFTFKVDLVYIYIYIYIYIYSIYIYLFLRLWWSKKLKKNRWWNL